MNKGKVVRLAGFVGALGLSTVLVTTAIQGTGAYFSASQGGSVSVKSGSVGLNIIHGTSTTLSFTGVMPGVEGYQSKNVDYQVTASSGKVDLWLTFDPTSDAYKYFTGGGSDGVGDKTGLGGYGYFQVSDGVGGVAFTSGNLKFSDNTNNPSLNGCTTYANGRGGSGEIVSDDGSNNNAVPFCGVPSKILLRSGVDPNATGTVTVTVGLDGYKNSAASDQNKDQVSVPFSLVAIQANHTP